MNCETEKTKTLKVLVVPLEHSNLEENFQNVFPKVVSDCNNLAIYWESLSRYSNNFDTSFKNLGLEDSKLLALFELVLFIIVSRDDRLHEYLYQGTGVQSNEYPDVTIYQKASNIAKGSQAVINLRDYLNSFLSSKTEISVFASGNNNNLKEDDLNKLVRQYDIDQLVEDRNDLNKLNDYSEELLNIYKLLVIKGADVEVLDILKDIKENSTDKEIFGEVSNKIKKYLLI